MTSPAHRSGGRDIRPRSTSPRHRRPSEPGRRRLLVGAQVITAMVSVAVVVITGVGWAKTHNLFGGITLSQALEGDPGSTGGDQNILIMGLDSRLDEHGRP